MEGIPEAEELIEEQVSTYSIWRTKISQLDKIEELRGVLNSVRLTELEKIQDSFRKGDYRALEAFSGTIMKEFLRLIPYLLDDQDNPIIKNGKNLKD
jgi:glutamyl-tRNA reductase